MTIKNEEKVNKESLTPLMPQNTDASVIEEFRRNNSNQNIDFTTPVRIIYENGIFKPANSNIFRNIATFLSEKFYLNSIL